MLRRPMTLSFVAALALGALLGAAAPAAAQAAKFGVIDTQRIVLESQTGKTALEQLKTLQEAKEGEVRAKQQELTDLRNRIAEGRLSLSEDRLAGMQDELELKARELRRMQEDAAAELEKRQNEVLGGIEKQVLPIINEVGRNSGYTLIFKKFESGLIYVDPSADLTEQVIQRLDSGAAGGS